MAMRASYVATLFCATLHFGPAFGGSVISTGAVDAAPACHGKADLVALRAAISRQDFTTVRMLSSGGRCWGVWDGSIGDVVDEDPSKGMSLVAFTSLARLPETRRETLWIETKYLAQHHD